jgi:hypothetical protein
VEAKQNLAFDDLSSFSSPYTWTDADAGTGVSSLENYENCDTFRLYNSTIAAGNRARRTTNLGTLASDPLYVTVRFKPVALDDYASSFSNGFRILVDNGTTLYQYKFASDGLWKYTSGSWSEVGTNINFLVGGTAVGYWQTWTFIFYDSTNTSDIYEIESTPRNNQKLATGTAMTGQASSADGTFWLSNNGRAVQSDVYVDYIKLGDNLQHVLTTT